MGYDCCRDLSSSITAKDASSSDAGDKLHATSSSTLSSGDFESKEDVLLQVSTCTTCC